jgi:DHA3 family macrolide efflux protein-like MFS transporter
MQTFIIIWFGQLISTVGSGLTSFALGVWIYTETRSTTLFALNILSFTLPGIVLSSPVGILVDRVDRRLVMIFSDVGSGLTTLGIWLLFLSGNFEIWHIYVASFVNATFSNLQWTAHSASTSLMVPKEHLGRASGMVAVSEATSMLISPVVAGALYVSIGLGGIILVDFITFCLAILTLLLVRIPKPKPSQEGSGTQGSFLQDALFGWKYIAARPGLLGLLIYFASLYFIVGMIDPLLEPMILEIAGPEIMGGIMSMMGVGYLGGTVLMSTWGGPRRRTLAILITGLVQGVVMIGFGISPSLILVTASVFLFSLLDPLVGGSSQAFWQTKVPADVQGRVFAVRRTISRIGLASSLLLAGPVAENVFEPLLLENGILAHSVGQVIGVGTGRGTGFLFVVLGLLFSLSSILGLIYAPLRLADKNIPDAI